MRAIRLAEHPAGLAGRRVDAIDGQLGVAAKFRRVVVPAAGGPEDVEVAAGVEVRLHLQSRNC